MAYVDGELDPETACEVERQIAVDPDARAEVEMYRGTAALLRAALAEAAARPRLLPPRLVTRRALSWAAASLAAGLVGVGVGRSLPGGGGSDLLDEVAEYHGVISHETKHLAELPAARAEEAAAWLGARLARKIVIPDLQAADLRYAGARILVIHAAPVADLLYMRENGDPVAICIARDPGRPHSVLLVRRRGLQLASWHDGSYAYVVVGDLDARDARDIAWRAAIQLQS